MAGSAGKQVGVRRLVNGERVTLRPEAGRQVCPICGQVTYRARTLDEPARWFRFDDTTLNLEHRCGGLLRSIPVGLPLVRRVDVNPARSQLTDAFGPMVAPVNPAPLMVTPRVSPGERIVAAVAALIPGPAVPAAIVDPAGVDLPGEVEATVPQAVPLWRSGAARVTPGPVPPKVLSDRPAGAKKSSPGSTLQGRIDAAMRGDTIDVEPGTYRESLTLRHHLTLRAVDDDVVIAPADGPAIALIGCGLTLEGITLRPTVGVGIVLRPGEREEARPIIGLKDCRIEAPTRAVFAMVPAVTIRLIHCALISETGSGVTLQTDSSMRSTQTTITTRGGPGILADDRAILQIDDTSIIGCGGDGVRVGRESIVWMDRGEPVRIQSNAGHGLALGPGSSATLTGTVITTNSG